MTLLVAIIWLSVQVLLEARGRRLKRLRTLTQALSKVRQELVYQAGALAVERILAQNGVTRHWSDKAEVLINMLTAVYRREGGGTQHNGEHLQVALQNLQHNLRVSIRFQERSQEQLGVLAWKLLSSAVCASIAVDALNLLHLIEVKPEGFLIITIMFSLYAVVAIFYIAAYPDAPLAGLVYREEEFLDRMEHRMTRILLVDFLTPKGGRSSERAARLHSSLHSGFHASLYKWFHKWFHTWLKIWLQRWDKRRCRKKWSEVWLQVLLLELHPHSRMWFAEWYQLKQEALRKGIANTKARQQCLTDAMRVRLEAARSRQRSLSQLFPLWQLLLFSLIMLSVWSVADRI